MILEELNLTKAELDDFKLHADKKIAKQLAELEELQEEAFKLNENLVYESVCYSKLNESYLTVQKDNAEIKRINDDLKDSCDRLTGQIVIMEQKVKAIQNQNEEAYQLLENELNNAQTASGEKDRIIANLQESLTKSSNLFEEERENHLYEIEQLNFSHENAVKISESVFEDLKKDWASIKSEFDDFQSRAEEAATSSALREESLQQKLIDLEVSSNMKDDEIRTVQSKLSELNIRAEKSISDLQASLCSAEKQYQEALKLVQQEKAQIMKNSLSEKATFLKKTAELNEIIDLQSSDISKLQSRLSEAEDNLLSMKNNAKIELGNLNNENSKLASKLDSEIKCSEKIVQDLAARLAEKSSQMMSLESKVLELENINERSEIRLSNEVSNRDLMIKHLESKLRESTKTLDLVRIECSAIKTEFQKFKDHTGATIEAKVEAQVQAATNELLRENTELEQKVSERADDEIALIQEIDSYAFC